MKRFVAVVALAIGLTASAQAQQTLTFDTPSAVYPGFTIVHASYQSGALFGPGMDVLPLYIASETPFAVSTLDLASATSTGNPIYVRGYTLDYIAAVDAAASVISLDGFYARLGDVPSVAFPPTLFVAALTADPGVFATLSLNWTGLGALVFSSTGGHLPGTPELVGGFLVDNIAVTTAVTAAPEPGSLLLLASGAMLIVLARLAARRLTIRQETLHAHV